MVERVIVTGADSRYFPLVDDLCASVRAFRSMDELGLAVIDGGLAADQKTHLTAQYGVKVLQFDWGFRLAEQRAEGRDYLKTQIGRAFLDVLLPDAALIGWIDADAWVQDIAAVDTMFKAAEHGVLAIVSQASRYGASTLPLRWRAFGRAEPRSFLYKNALRGRLPIKQARFLADKATLNSGVFVMAQDNSCWETWRRRQAEAIRWGRVFTSDQFALAVAVYIDGTPINLAPDICNYMGPWTCSNDGCKLLEAYMPNATVGIVHMAGQNDIRRDPRATLSIKRLDGATIRKSLRRSAWVTGTD